MKYSTLDLSHSEYLPVHSGVIRDTVFSPQGDGLVLTASMDRTCKLTSVHSNSNVLTLAMIVNFLQGFFRCVSCLFWCSYKTSGPVWACAWNEDNINYVYAGLNGCVCVYDLRNTEESVSSLQIEGDRAPVTSLSYVPLCGVSSFR